MKKFEVKSLLVMLLALAMVFSLAACKRGVDDTTAPGDDTTEPTVIDPIVTDPPETDPPEVTNPPETDPIDPGSEETDPKYDPIETDPPETKPAETDPPETTKPVETEPVETQCTHSYVAQVTHYPTCVTEGEEAMVCTKCGDRKDVKPIETVGHNFYEKECEIVSLTHHKAIVLCCDVCGRTSTIKELTEEHDFKSTVVVPDYTTAGKAYVYGYEVLSCKGCDYQITVGANATDGHYYTPDEGSGKLVCACGAAATDKTVMNGNKNAGPQLFPQG